MQNLLYYSTGSRNTGRILVHIEATIEVGDTCPFNVNQLIDDRLSTIILFIKSMIKSAEHICGQRLALFCPVVYLLLKLGKHRLAEKRSTKTFQ